jgi:hypothetical protein
MGKFGLNSGYIGSNQVTTEQGVVSQGKYYLERKAGNFAPSDDVLSVRGGLVLYLNAFDTDSYPGTGTVWYDLSDSYDNNGTLYNGVGFDTTNGNGLVFDGSNDKVYVAANSSLNFSSTQQYTVVAVVNPYGGGTTWHGIVSKGNTQQYALTINSPSAYFHYETNQGGTSALNSNASTVTYNSWQHMVAMYDGTNKTIRKNNSIIATQSAPTLNSSTNLEELRIGEGNTSELFRGKIGVVCIYNRALNTTELTSVYQAFKTIYNYS